MCEFVFGWVFPSWLQFCLVEISFSEHELKEESRNMEEEQETTGELAMLLRKNFVPWY